MLEVMAEIPEDRCGLPAACLPVRQGNCPVSWVPEWCAGWYRCRWSHGTTDCRKSGRIFISFHWDATARASAPGRPPHQTHVHSIFDTSVLKGRCPQEPGLHPCRWADTRKTPISLFAQTPGKPDAQAPFCQLCGMALWESGLSVSGEPLTPPGARPCSMPRVIGSSRALGNASFLLAGVLSGPRTLQRGRV